MVVAKYMPSVVLIRSPIQRTTGTAMLSPSRPKARSRRPLALTAFVYNPMARRALTMARDPDQLRDHALFCPCTAARAVNLLARVRLWLRAFTVDRLRAVDIQMFGDGVFHQVLSKVARGSSHYRAPDRAERGASALGWPALLKTARATALR